MAVAMNNVDDIKMSNHTMQDNSDSSSSDDDSGIIMTKEMRQLTKLQTQVSKNLNKIQAIRVKLNDNDIHEVEKTQFEALLIKINITLAKEEQQPGLAIKNQVKQLKKESKQVKNLFQSNKRAWKAIAKAEKMQRKADKHKNKAEKQKYKAEKAKIKAKIKAEKEKLKQEKKIIKEQKKLEKEERKQAKLEFAQKLEKARIEELPIKEQKLLELWIDGWNISGCFGGRSRSKRKLIDLLQEFYTFYTMSAKDNGFADLNNIELFYDGNGQDKLDKNVNISHSGKNIIVDDLWINLLSQKQENGIDTSHIVCVTSDRELTVRLHNIGVTVMKSGKFFKTYLKQLLPPKETKNDDNKNNGKNDNDIKMDT